MDKEERAKYDCPKDKENLDKALKTGRSFTYLSQYSRKNLYSTIAVIAIELLIFTVAFLIAFAVMSDKLEHQKELLVVQVDKYIKTDFKNMNCIEKNVFLEKYMTDKTIYGHQEMQDWLQENFNDNCASLMEKK